MKPISTLLSAAFFVVFSSALAATSGCSNDAEAKCEEFIKSYCAKIVSCDTTVTTDKCVTTFQKTLECSKAIDAPSNFDKCPGDIQALKCTKDAPAIPDSCDIKIGK